MTSENSTGQGSVHGRVCPNCGHRNRRGVIFCEECGIQVGTGAPPLSAQLATVQIGDHTGDTDENIVETVQMEGVKADIRPGTSVFEPNMVLRLEIEGVNEPLFLRPFDKKQIIFGRQDLDNAANNPDVDLMPYGGYNKGISRRHAALLLKGKRLSLIDLDSSNGTFLNEDSLEPHEPYQLRDGDDIQMGNLLMHITFQASA